MSTNATISYVIRDKDSNISRIKNIYVHWDGYPEHTFEILKEHYTDPQKIQDLINLGSLSSIYKYCSCPQGHSFNSPKKDYCVAYHRDRGDDLTILEFSDFKALRDHVKDVKYNYIYDGKWMHFEANEENQMQKTACEDIMELESLFGLKKVFTGYKGIYLSGDFNGVNDNGRGLLNVSIFVTLSNNFQEIEWTPLLSISTIDDSVWQALGSKNYKLKKDAEEEVEKIAKLFLEKMGKSLKLPRETILNEWLSDLKMSGKNTGGR